MLGLGLGIQRAQTRGKWSPARIITALWLDASRADTITENVTVPGNVAQWDDLSGNGNHAEQDGNEQQPITGVNSLNGLNVIKFDSDFMSFASSITGIKSAIFATNNLDGASLLTNTSIIFSGADDFTFVQVNALDSAYDISINGTGSNSGNASVNGGSLVSGGDIDLGQTNAQNESPNVWYVDFDNAVLVDSLADYSATGRLKGDIAEIILLDYIPTTETRQEIEVYLQDKWNTPSLP